jgi:mannose-6-phosphate isomerase-like protein (cupin superfamily)
MGREFALTDSETLTVRVSSEELLEVAAEWGPHADRPPPPHFHPRQDEHFEVLAGELTAKVDGQRHVLHAGDALDIPRGAVHAIWNSGGDTARATWQVRPALRTEEFWQDMSDLRAAGCRSKRGTVDLPGAALLFRTYRGEIRLKASNVVTGLLLPALAAWARLRGYPTVGKRRR